MNRKIRSNQGRKLLSLSLIFLSFFFLFSFVSATSFEQETSVDLKISTNSSGCVITVAYPDSGIMIQEQPMTDNVGYANYTLSSTLTSTLGEYKGYSNCSTEEISFNIESSNLNLTIGFYFILLILSMGIVILGFYIKDYWVIVLGGFGMILLGLFLLFYGIDGFKDTAYTWGIGIIILVLGGYFSIRGSLESLS